MNTQQQIQDRVAELRRRHPFPDQEQQAATPEHAPASHSPAPPALHFDVRISGDALQDAHAGIERITGNAVLTVLLQQPLCALPVVATLRLTNSPACHTVAHAMARRLRSGAAVTVRGKGIALADHQGQQALRVLDVQAIDPPPEPTTRKDLE